MKTKIVSVLLLFIFLTSCQASSTTQNTNEVTWGMTVEELKSIHSVSDVSSEFGENMTVYRGNNQEVFGIDSEVNYVFYNGKLGTVYCHDIKAEGYTQNELFNFIKNNIVVSYGSASNETELDSTNENVSSQYSIWIDAIPDSIIALVTGLTYKNAAYSAAKGEELNLFFYSTEFSNENFKL